MNLFQSLILLLYITLSYLNQCQCNQYRITDQIYMDIKLENEHLGRIIFGLFGDVAPKTVKNFKHIALHGINGKSYVNTNFLIAIKKIMILGGDIVNNNGTGSLSIYGTYFEDEKYEIKYESAGLLAMAHLGGPNTNGCMFFITTMATPWLNGKSVIFGKVLKGHGVVHKIEHLSTDINDRLLRDVKIIACGEIIMSPYYEDHKNYEITLWAWIVEGWFPLSFSFAILGFFHYIFKQLNKFDSFK